MQKMKTFGESFSFPFLWVILLENERKMSDKRKAEKAIEHNANLRPVCMDSMRL